MANDALNKVFWHLRRAVLLQDGAGLSDGKLLGMFVDQGDEAAFEVLMRRHGPTILGMCRRILLNPQDAEDAVQATFLVLLRKASSIMPREMVGSWLYGVARQTATRMRAQKARRRWWEKQVATMPEPRSLNSRSNDDLLILDEELSRLPDKYRIAIILCDLQGKTRKQAAGQLGWAEGTVSSRLARGRTMLASALPSMACCSRSKPWWRSCPKIWRRRVYHLRWCPQRSRLQASWQRGKRWRLA